MERVLSFELLRGLAPNLFTVGWNLLHTWVELARTVGGLGGRFLILRDNGQTSSKAIPDVAAIRQQAASVRDMACIGGYRWWGSRASFIPDFGLAFCFSASYISAA